MFLHSIELFGFKSFAEKSLIEFNRGISALVGPNGCGKSNVVDSLKWVLGEQSTKTLRAEKMEDVIFNGTDSRKALSVAEVTLILGNDAGRLPIDLAEVAVRRRLYRSGESEYYINGSLVKLRDVRELFFDTGVGKTAYSIMEQGKIDQILSNKPEDRRYIFEEAAGITKYKARGAEAERKLERTEENMRQVEGILREVKRTHDVLQSQAEKANQYRSLRDEMFNHELTISLLKLRDLLSSDETRGDRLKEKEDAQEALRRKIEEHSGSVESEMDAVNEREASLIQKQKELYGLELERNNCDSQIQVHKERIEETRRFISGRREREASLEKQLEGLVGQIEEKHRTLSELQRRLSEIEGNIGAFEQNVAAAQGRIKENDGSISGHTVEVSRLEGEVEGLQESLRALYDDIVTQLDARLRETGYTFQQKQQAEEAVRTAIDSLIIHLTGRIELLGDALAVESMKTDERNRMLSSARDVIRECLDRVVEINGLWGVYVGSVPDFIDEFVAPEGIITRKREIDARVEEVRQAIVSHREEAEKLRTENRHLSERIEEYRKTLEELRLNRVRIRTQKSSLEEAVAIIVRQRSDSEERLAESRREIETSEARLARINEQVEETRKRRQQIESERATLERQLAELEGEIAERNRKLVEREKRLKQMRGDLESQQSQIEKLRVELAAIRSETRSLYESFAEQHSRDLREYQDGMLEIRTQAAEHRAKLSELREKLRNLGQVNLMAPEEYKEIKERYDFLAKQLQDLQSARQDLHTVTQQIKSESTELFLETYDKVKRNFHTMFRRLFGGGRAELALTDEAEVLSSGVEILAQPPGKKLEAINLLSGGERSLTAVALLFAIYMVRPSPFCVLDEIDAALDEENVGRFTSLLREFGGMSQFIIITHNKRTISCADSLLGVTMEEAGVSRVISVRLGEREEVEV